MVDRPPRSRRRPPRDLTNEEIQLDLLQRIADDLHGLKTVFYWIVGIQIAAAVVIFIVAISNP